MPQVDPFSFAECQAGQDFTCGILESNRCNHIIGTSLSCRHDEMKTEAGGDIELERMLAGSVVVRFDGIV